MPKLIDANVNVVPIKLIKNSLLHFKRLLTYIALLTKIKAQVFTPNRK